MPEFVDVMFQWEYDYLFDQIVQEIPQLIINQKGIENFDEYEDNL